MQAAVFFADVLGFSALASASGAAGAAQALADVTLLFSDKDELAKYLQRDAPWRSRYALSDSLVLVADDPVAAVREASRFYYRLALINASRPHETVLMRGGIAFGEVFEGKPVFPETAKGNVLGEAVVRAVKLEQSGAKGPRLLLDDAVARAVETSSIGWLLDRSDQGPEALWLLPPDPNDCDVSELRPVCAAAAKGFLGARDDVASHWIAYMDLVFRSLVRLKETRPDEARALFNSMDCAAVTRRLEQLLLRDERPEQRVLRRMSELR